MAAPTPPLPSVLLKFVKEHFLKFQLLPDDYNSIAQDGVSRSVIMKQVKQKQYEWLRSFVDEKTSHNLDPQAYASYTLQEFIDGNQNGRWIQRVPARIWTSLPAEARASFGSSGLYGSQNSKEAAVNLARHEAIEKLVKENLQTASSTKVDSAPHLLRKPQRRTRGPRRTQARS